MAGWAAFVQSEEVRIAAYGRGKLSKTQNV